jgi:hypothetical protein
MRRRVFLAVAGLAVVVGLPVLGHLARRRAPDECALDGVKIVPLYRVRVVDVDGQDRVFCCVKCAEIWLRAQANAPRAVYVTDEKTGRECDSAAAWFVVNSEVTTPTTVNRIHVFHSRADADANARDYAGVVLEDSEKPFQTAQHAAAR